MDVLLVWFFRAPSSIEVVTVRAGQLTRWLGRWAVLLIFPVTGSDR